MGELKHDAHECGWDIDVEAKHNWKRMQKNVAAHIKGINFGYRKQMTANNVKYYNSLASFVDPHTLNLVDAKNKEERITGMKIVLAVGGRPITVDLPGYKEHSITSDDLFW